MTHGKHWTCLYEDLGAFADKDLPELLKTLHIIGEQEWQAPGPAPEGLSPDRLVYLSEDDGYLRHLLVVAMDDSADQNALYGAFPFCAAGIEHTVTVTGIAPLENGIEAHIEGTVGNGTKIGFFDPLYGLNAEQYEIGGTYRFRLAAIAYDIQAPDREFVEITDPARSARVRQMIRDAGGTVGDGDGPMKLQLNGAAMMFPIEEWETGDYSFYAPIKLAERCTLGGQTLSALQITPMRLGNQDYDIILFAAPHVREDESYTPKAGGDVTGAFWLQGHLTD